MGKISEFVDRHLGIVPSIGRTLWFRKYALTTEDVDFIEHMRGATLVPTLVRLPSGLTVTGADLREWFTAYPDEFEYY